MQYAQQASAVTPPRHFMANPRSRNGNAFVIVDNKNNDNVNHK
jgi:hypothetical protein